MNYEKLVFYIGGIPFFSLYSSAQNEEQDPRFLFNKFEKGKVVFYDYIILLKDV